MNKDKDSEIILAIDYGETNIGIAFGRNKTVTALRNLSGKNTNTAIHEIIREAARLRAQKIVFGLPLTYNHKETAQARKTRHFVNLLKVYYKKPIVFENEFRTSEEAVEETIGMGISPKKRKLIDQYSAAIILKRYFESKN